MPMMRSESRTEETSGLVTTTATSAWRIASVAPFSMPAGLSQMIQSNFSRSSSTTRATPSVGQRVLVAGLRGRQQRQVVHPLVADQRLRQLGVALDHVDQVEHDAPLGPHHQVEVAQPDVEIDHDDGLPALRQRRPKRGGGGGLADPSLAGCHDQNLGHLRPPPSSLSVQGRHDNQIAFEPGVHRPASQRRIHVVGGAVDPVDRHQFRFQLPAEYPRPRVAVNPATARPRNAP